MSVLDELRTKADKTPLENAVAFFADYELEARQDGKNIIATLAASELAAMQARIAELEAERDALTRCILTVVAPDGFGQFGDWEGCPVCDGHAEHTDGCELAAALAGQVKP